MNGDMFKTFIKIGKFSIFTNCDNYIITFHIVKLMINTTRAEIFVLLKVKRVFFPQPGIFLQLKGKGDGVLNPGP